MKNGVSIFIINLLISFPIASALSYTYDSNGNRISGDGFYRDYDSSNHLVNVYTGSEPLIANLVENYTWSLTEERVVAKYVYYNRTLNESVYYPYENWVRVVNSSGSFDFYYVIQNSEVVAMQDYAGHKFYYHNDHKGSVQLVTNENGSAIERTFYEPFGVVTFGGSKTRFDYEGEEFDSVTGDYDFDARRFDSSNNQFIQPDSVIQNVYDPQSLNHYSFERNNPYKYEDENGHDVFYVGFGVNYGWGRGGGLSNGLAYSQSLGGNINFGNYKSTSSSLSSPTAGVGLEFGFSGAGNLNEYSGKSKQFGGDIGGLFNFPISIGAQFSVPYSMNYFGDKVYNYNQISFGVTVGPDINPIIPASLYSSDVDTNTNVCYKGNVKNNREKSNNQNNQQKFNNNKQNGDSSPFKEVIKWIFGI